MEDDPFSKLKESLDQLQQHDEDFVPEDFRYDDLLTVDDDVAIMGGVMTEEEILLEIRENETVEEDEEDSDDEDEISVKPTQEIHQAIETLVNFSTFTESGEVGAIALNASSLIKMELNRSMRQMTIADCFKKQ